MVELRTEGEDGRREQIKSKSDWEWVSSDEDVGRLRRFCRTWQVIYINGDAQQSQVLLGYGP